MPRNTTRDRQKEISAIVGENLKRARTMAGMSQETLGDHLGVTFQQVQKYERGSNRVSAPVLLELCGILGIELADLFAGCEGAKRVRGISTSPIPNVSPKTLDLAERLNALPRGKAKDGLLQLIDALTS